MTYTTKKAVMGINVIWIDKPNLISNFKFLLSSSETGMIYKNHK